MTSREQSPADFIAIEPEDDGVQENTTRILFSGAGPARFTIEGDPVDLSRQNTGDMAIHMRLKVNDYDGGKVDMTLGCGEGACGAQDMSDYLASAAKGEWQELSVKLGCFAQGPEMTTVDVPVNIRTSSKLSLSISDIKLVANEGQAVCLQ
jgi:beta-glucosidase